MPISAQTYERVALEDPEGRWELWCGRLREKPPVTIRHADAISALTVILVRALDERAYVLRGAHTRLQVPGGSYYVPDLCVVSAAMAAPLRATPHVVEVYDDPVPLVVEAWSPSTDGYDVTAKLPEYQRQGDAEIWYIHPYERTLTAWRRQTDGSYSETVFRGGMVSAVALPNVAFDLASLFEE